MFTPSRPLPFLKRAWRGSLSLLLLVFLTGCLRETPPKPAADVAQEAAARAGGDVPIKNKITVQRKEEAAGLGRPLFAAARLYKSLLLNTRLLCGRDENRTRRRRDVVSINVRNF